MERIRYTTGIAVIAQAVAFLFMVVMPVHAAYRGYDGEFVSVTYKTVRLQEGAAITLEAAFRNTGTVAWRNDGQRFLSLNVATPFYHESALMHPFWYSRYQPARLAEREVAPGEVGTFRFAIAAPDTPGMYEETFMLSAEDTAWLRDTEFSIRVLSGDVDVKGITTEDTLEARILEAEGNGTSTDAVNEETRSSITLSEPFIRVGLYKTTDPVIITADTAYAAETPDGTVAQTFDSGERVVTFFDDYSNTFYLSGREYYSAVPFARFSGLSTSTIFTVISFDNPSKWQEGVNDNRFRGSIEVRYGEKSDSPWVINELLLEDYIKGIKETSEISPEEYQKAIAVAARTYALWHYQDGMKHAGNNFVVDAVWDQVYRGVNAEELIPSFSKAVDATHGTVITYDGEVAFTTYFAQSDGKTRNSQDVWGGEYRPWLVSVPDPTNQGLQLWGHGVGMSARGALLMASRYGSTFEEILKHYYTGIDVEQRYERGVEPERID